MTWLGLLIVLLIVGGAAALVFVGLRERQNSDPLASRLAEYAARGEVASLEEIELSQPFMERVVYPAARRFGEIAQRFTPAQAIIETRRRLEMAGAPRWLEPTVFLASRFVFGLGLGGLMFLVYSISGDFSLTSVLVILATTVVGFFIPNLLLDSRLTRRKRAVLNSMPDALDLLTISVEAGLGFDAALKKVTEKWDNDLSHAFARALQEIQLGKLRREALRDMASRLNLPEMDSFVAAVIQSEQLGVSMSRVLRVQSDSMRIKRRQRAEERAQQAPVKMLLPMVTLILPTIFILLMGPAVLQVMRSGIGF
ncbi:MAG: type II secretion system F family protein [Anaerolineales bacterium]|nr:type II secretion system F family protein [Anaerolineales bacterium]